MNKKTRRMEIVDEIQSIKYSLIEAANMHKQKKLSTNGLKNICNNNRERVRKLEQEYAKISG
jgi:hypothetical protein